LIWNLQANAFPVTIYNTILLTDLFQRGLVGEIIHIQGETLTIRTLENKQITVEIVEEALSPSRADFKIGEWTGRKKILLAHFPLCLSASTKDKYRTVTAYFPRDEWDLLQRISENSDRCKKDTASSELCWHGAMEPSFFQLPLLLTSPAKRI